jgi:hypothetical protein
MTTKLTAAQKNSIKKRLAAQVKDAPNTVYIKALKVDYRFLSGGELFINEANGIATFTDYRYGDDGLETFKNEVRVSI